MKVSVYTLQFMFIKIKWETREGRRWEKGEDGRGIHTGHKTSARAVRNAKNLCIKLVPFEKGGQTNCVGENEQITLQGCSKGLLISNYSCCAACAFLKR